MQDQVNMLLKIAFNDEYHNLDTNRRDVTQGRSKLLIVFFKYKVQSPSEVIVYVTTSVGITVFID